MPMFQMQGAWYLKNSRYRMLSPESDAEHQCGCNVVRMDEIWPDRLDQLTDFEAALRNCSWIADRQAAIEKMQRRARSLPSSNSGPGRTRKHGMNFDSAQCKLSCLAHRPERCLRCLGNVQDSHTQILMTSDAFASCVWQIC